MEYVVKVDYKKFRFKDSGTAMGYAEMSKVTAVKPVDVEIELVEEEKTDPAEEPQDQQVSVTSVIGSDSQTSHNPRGIGATWG